MSDKHMEMMEEELKTIEHILEEQASGDMVELPESFDNEVAATLRNLPAKPSYWLRNSLRAVAGFIGIIFILSVMIYSNDSFAEMSMKVPGLNVLASMIIGGDVGFQHAVDSGYPVIDEVFVSEEGVEVRLNNILIDEERIHLEAHVSMVDPDTLVKRAIHPIHYDIRLDLEDAPSTMSGNHHDDNTLILDFQLHKEGLIRGLIDEGTPLTFKCVIYKHENLFEETYGSVEDLVIDISDDQKMENIEAELSNRDMPETFVSIEGIDVPLSAENVLLSKSYLIDERIEFEGAIVEVDKLIVSPSSMELVTRLETGDEQVTINGTAGRVLDIGLQDIGIQSDRLKNFTTPSASASGWGPGERRYHIIPSVYFDDPDEMIITYDSHYYALEHEPLYLSEEDDFPMVFSYFGYDITIEDFKVYEHTVLIKVSYMEEDDFTFQAMSLKGLQSSSSSASYFRDDDGREVIESHTYYEDLEHLDKYEIVVDYPKLYVREGGFIKVEMPDEE